MGFAKLKEVEHSQFLAFSNGRTALHYDCFLKYCFFCNKILSLDKEVYMYRGELGFCSVDCRNRQIYLDEMKKIEIYTKKMLASLMQQRREGVRCSKTTLLSKDDWQRGEPLSCLKNRVTFTLS